MSMKYVIGSLLAENSKRSPQLQKAIDLVILENDNDIPAKVIHYASHGEFFEGLLNDEIDIAIVDSDFEIDYFPSTKPILMIPSFPIQLTQSALNFIKLTGWEFVRLITCDSFDCLEFADYFKRDCEADDDIHLLSARSIAATDFSMIKDEIEYTKIAVVYGDVSYIHHLFAVYDSLSDINLTVVLITNDCDGLLVSSEYCDAPCVLVVADALRGNAICIEQEISIDYIWQANVWNANTNQKHLSLEDVSRSGKSDWGGSNMDEEVPIIWDLGSWILEAVTEECITNIQVEGSQDFDQLTDECLTNLITDDIYHKNVISNYEFTSGMMIYNPQDSVQTVYKYLTFPHWVQFGESNRDSRILTEFDIHDIEWGGDGTLPTSTFTAEPWPGVEFLAVGFYAITVLMVFLTMLWLSDREKSRFYLGLMSKAECQTLLGVVVVALMSVLAAVLVDSFSWFICRASIMGSALQVAIITFLILCIRDFKGVVLNTGLSVRPRLNIRRKLLLSSLGMFLDFCLVVLRDVELDTITEKITIQNDSNKIETIKSCYHCVEFIISADVWECLLMSILGIIGLFYLIFNVSLIQFHAREFMIRTKRYFFFKVVMWGTILMSLTIILKSAIMVLSPSCDLIDKKREIYSCEMFDVSMVAQGFYVVFNMIALWLLVLLPIWCEVIFVNQHENHERMFRIKEMEQLVPKHRFSDRSKGNTDMKRFQHQKARTPIVFGAGDGVLVARRGRQIDDIDSDNSNDDDIDKNNNNNENEDGNQKANDGNDQNEQSQKPNLKKFTHHSSGLLIPANTSNTTTQNGFAPTPKADIHSTASTANFFDDVELAPQNESMRDFSRRIRHLPRNQRKEVKAELKHQLIDQRVTWIKQRRLLKAVNKMINHKLDKNDVLSVRARRRLKQLPAIIRRKVAAAAARYLQQTYNSSSVDRASLDTIAAAAAQKGGDACNKNNNPADMKAYIASPLSHALAVPKHHYLEGKTDEYISGGTLERRMLDANASETSSSMIGSDSGTTSQPEQHPVVHFADPNISLKKQVQMKIHQKNEFRRFLKEEKMKKMNKTYHDEQFAALAKSHDALQSDSSSEKSDSNSSTRKNSKTWTKRHLSATHQLPPLKHSPQQQQTLPQEVPYLSGRKEQNDNTVYEAKPNEEEMIESYMKENHLIRHEDLSHEDIVSSLITPVSPATSSKSPLTSSMDSTLPSMGYYKGTQTSNKQIHQQHHHRLREQQHFGEETIHEEEEVEYEPTNSNCNDNKPTKYHQQKSILQVQKVRARLLLEESKARHLNGHHIQNTASMANNNNNNNNSNNITNNNDNDNTNNMDISQSRTSSLGMLSSKSLVSHHHLVNPPRMSVSSSSSEDESESSHHHRQKQQHSHNRHDHNHEEHGTYGTYGDYYDEYESDQSTTSTTDHHFLPNSSNHKESPINNNGEIGSSVFGNDGKQGNDTFAEDNEREYSDLN